MTTVLGKGENLIAGKVLTLGSLTPTNSNAPPPTDNKSRLRIGANRGIRNLLVVCYDVDPSVVITPNTTAPEDVEGVVLEQAVGPSFWARFPGQRLGSTLTDANGDWSLVYQDDLEADAEPPRRIARPDLLIFVLAPEDTHEQLRDFPSRLPDLKELWVPDLVPQRVLHFSRELRLNAGRLEHYVVRIDEDVLARAGVSDWIGRPAATDDPARALTDFFNRHDQLSELLHARRREEVHRLQGIRERIRSDGRIRSDFLSSETFRGHASATYGGPAYVPATSTGDPGVTIESVGRVLGAAVARLPEEPPEDSPLRRFRFRLTNDEARGARLLRTGDRLAETVSVDWLVKRYRKATASDMLLANGSPLARCTQERAVDAAVARVMHPEPSTPPPGPVSSDSDFTYNLNTQLERIMQEMAAPAFDSENLIADRLNSTSLEQQLDRVKLQPGPADVTAYHYFHRLELALPHIWTELFDDGVSSRGVELYAQLVRTQQDYLPDSETYQDALNHVEHLRALIRAAEEAEDSGTDAWRSVLDQFPQITKSTWNMLDPAARQVITGLANRSRGLESNVVSISVTGAPAGTAAQTVSQTDQITAADLRRRAYDVVTAVLGEAPKENPKGRLGRLVLELTERLTGPYKFTIFAPNTVNFGLFITYRQAWRPINYQVGRLVKTIPLAPGEAREYSIKRVEKKSRNEKEVENNLRVKKSEAESKGTIESQIANKASNKSNWKLAAEGSGSIGVFSASASASLEGGAEGASEDTKKSMREAVQKANEEDKKEHNWEVSTTQELQVDTAESVKISNPNQEIPVTYLLYELERRYGISEKLHAVQPVVLVANEVPAPHEVDEDFLISHDWIIRRALLDDEFQPALNYLSEGFAGDEFRLEVLRLAKAQRVQTLQDLKNELEPYETMLAEKTDLLDTAVKMLARQTSDDEEEAAAAWRIKEQAARETLQRVTQGRADIKSLIDRGSADLAEAEKALADALQTHVNMQTEITRLRIHVAQNIIYYMQAIWDTEHPDQRYFRLYNIQVPKIPFPDADDAPPPPAAVRSRILRSHPDPLTREWICEASLPPPAGFAVPPPDATPGSWPTLGEVADLGNLLGYKGNYMIFPLKNASDRNKGNYLTAFMAQSYVSDSGKGASDPDPAGDATLDELICYFRCIKEARERTHTVPGAPPLLADDAEAMQEMRDLIASRKLDPYKDEQELIVRTDSLFIEALPGSHPVLEDFKLRHRALDVQKVGAEMRGLELENLRLAETLRAGEREDPRVDKRIEVKGATVLSVTEPDGPGG